MRMAAAWMAVMLGSTVMMGQASDAASTGVADATPAAVAETSVKAVLKAAWDSKSARVGDTLIAVTQADVTLPDGRVLPKNSEIRGNVMSETTYSPNTGRGVLTFLFDEVKIKGLKKKKAMAPVHAMIHIAEPPAKSSNAGGELKDDSGVVDATSAPMLESVGRVDRGSAAKAGEPLVTAHSATSNAPVPGAAATSPAASAATPAAPPADAATRPNANVGQSSLPGIRLSARASSGASGTFIAVGQELQIKKGTVLTFGLSAAE